MIHFELKNVSKCHGIDSDRPVWANKEVNLKLDKGLIHGLVGENGAGKSTAMKIIFGLEKPTSGQLFFEEKTISDQWSPQMAFKSKIGMVHQHFMLAQQQSVLDNIVLGAELTNFFGYRSRNLETTRLEKLMCETGLKIPLEKKVHSLTVSEQSKCEILKVLYRNAELIILDEPTAVLTPSQTEALLQSLMSLKKQGKTILIVTHKLGEIIQIADNITVMRGGTTIDTFKNTGITVDSLAEKMIGRPLLRHNLPPCRDNDSVDKWTISTNQFNIEVKPGEIVGVAGIEGNGQQKIIDAITCDAAKLRRETIAFIPPDRHREAVILEWSALKNFTFGQDQFKKPFWKNYSSDHRKVTSLFQAEDIRPNAPELPMKSFSGGNQQKIVVARELFYGPDKPKKILACHPTRGVDLGAVEHIHRHLIQQCRDGASILLISSELEELFSLSHRIVVLHNGNVVSWHLRSHYLDSDARNITTKSDFKYEQAYDEKQIGYEMLTGTLYSQNSTSKNPNAKTQ